MLTDDQLCARWCQSESMLVERKASKPNTREIRTTLVAFANAVPPNEFATLFLGIGPDGRIVGLQNPDTAQQDIRKTAAEECFPAVTCHFKVMQVEGKEILAVIIPYSPSRPHFTGHAYIRVGSENVKSSQAILDEMIASRNTLAGRLLAHKNKLISVQLKPNPNFYPVNTLPISKRDYRIDHCDAHSVRLADLSSNLIIEVPLPQCWLSYDTARSRLKLTIKDPDYGAFGVFK